MSDFRFYTVEDLKRLRPGTVFFHQTLGKCIVLRGKDHKKMVFKRPDKEDAYFIKDGYPWNIPMKVLL